MIPVRVGVPAGARDNAPVFVVELVDAVQPSLYSSLREAERSYRAELKAWGGLLITARQRRGDPLPRLELGRRLDAFFESLVRDRGISVTNQEEALTKQLEISRADLDYIRRASRQFSPEDVARFQLTWTQVISMTGIRDPAKLRECLRLIGDGLLRSQDEIRDFRRKANRPSD